MDRDRVADLFEQALDLPVEERNAWIADACGADTSLRTELERLLRADARAGEFMERPPALIAAAMDASAIGVDSLPQFGQWRTLRKIGSGGMGEVWLAERNDGEFEQRVAIKQLSYPTPGLMQRFRQERQILARLEHPNIARLIDGGITAGGSPYLVMDYVDGVPITQYAREQDLDLRARLHLFLQVCGAVQYAHQNLVVHRDLKPSNILVGTDGAPKLLDFGIAKVLATTDVAAQTQTAARLLTPDYAAPEQFRGGAITTATDVYALGVVLYELLVGSRPMRDARSAAIDPIGDVTAPSAALDRTTGDAGKRRRELRGDLDRISLTALAAEPQRRYPSVEALAADLQHYLQGRPIAARGDSAMYRLRKFVRRNRWTVATAVFVFAVCIAATIISLRQARHALEQATRAQAVRSFLVGVFKQASPDQNKGKSITAHELLDAGARQLAENKEDPPEVKADLAEVIAGLYADIGDDERAQSLHEANIDQHRKDIPDAIRLRSLIGLSNIAERRGTLPVAQAYLAQGLTVATSGTGVDPLDVSELRRRRSAIEGLANPVAAETLAREALAYDLAEFGETSQQVLDDWDTLSDILRSLSRDDEAKAAARKAVAIARAMHGNEHTSVASMLDSLGIVLRVTGDYPAAVSAHEEALAISTRIKGADHPDTLQYQSNLLVAMQSNGQYLQALPLLLDNLARTRKVLGDDDQRVAHALGSLATSWKKMGEFANAETAHREAAGIWTKVEGPDGAQGAANEINLGSVLLIEGRNADAEVVLRSALRRALLHYPETSKHVRVSRVRLALAVARAGKPQEAIALVEALVDVPAPTNETERYILAASQMAFVEALLRLDRTSEAQTRAQSALELMLESHPPDVFNTGRAQFLLGCAEAAQGRHAEAETMLRQAISTLALDEEAVHGPRLIEAKIQLAETLMALGKRNEVSALIGDLQDPLAGDEYPYKTELRARLQKLSAGAGNEGAR
jgi:serine/threonine-protein kinase